MPKNNSLFLIIIFVVGLIASFFLLTSQTNILYKHAGTTFTKNVYFQTDKDVDGGYITLLRDQRTLSVMDWARFDNDKQVDFFSIDRNNYIKKTITFTLPDKMNAGKYYVIVEAEFLSGRVESKILSFRVI